ncbi:sulfate adenylyltransferase, partial [Acinetobacter baumannii]|nr:sulfate adenylyltransferase [Acinetobacter baumannii]
MRVGQAVRVLPANRETTVAEVLTPNGSADSAGPGETITVRLADDVDISRGDTIVAAPTTATNAAKKLHAD